MNVLFLSIICKANFWKNSQFQTIINYCSEILTCHLITNFCVNGQVETLLCGFVQNTVSRGVFFCCLRLCALERQPSILYVFSRGGGLGINLQVMGGYYPRIIITISIKQAKVNNRNVLFAKSTWSTFSQTIQQQQLCWFIFSRFLWPVKQKKAMLGKKCPLLTSKHTTV